MSVGCCCCYLRRADVMDIPSIPRGKLHMRERDVCDMLGIHSLLSCVREREMKQVEKNIV